MQGRARGAPDTGRKRRRSPEAMMSSLKRKGVREEAVLNREDVSDDEMSVWGKPFVPSTCVVPQADTGWMKGFAA